ncbi:MAG TPA: bifunctional phosphoribosyl-AMP cyclohydrolase/phosphoribosyl-ATP diphosphatase HisIE [Planctomycetota bacterium]|nr:bifunctional phosphoribosyl-AMP cyclohydrolase/phosphoribosyl-ATP diphosphatase HisIE [Planctomycetota bacterium]
MKPFDSAPGGLLPVIAQDVRTNDVLMMAYMDAEALRRTKKTGYMHYWSRSRKKYWKKGEESGHVQKLVSLHFDCDRDTILARVVQTGPACHTGSATCWTKKPWRVHPAIDDLLATFAERKRKPKKGSYTNRLLADPSRLRQKLIEEVCELEMAVRAKRKKEIASEGADVLYHYLLLLFSSGVPFQDVADVLASRRR